MKQCSNITGSVHAWPVAMKSSGADGEEFGLRENFAGANPVPEHKLFGEHEKNFLISLIVIRIILW